MRAVCFVKRLEFELCGNVFQNAVALGDIDNDGHNELVVGNSSGDLSIFKGDRILQTFTNLGMITAVGIGDIFNCGHNALVVVCGDGWCRILFEDQQKNEDAKPKQFILEVVYVQRIPANTKVVLLADVDGDGSVELVMGLTDRVVRSYRWVTEAEIPLPGVGKLLGLNKWECASQIGTVSLNHSADGTPELLVAQPGGTLMTIHCQPLKGDEASQTDSEPLVSTSIDYHPLSCSRMRNPNVSTEIVGDISSDEGMRYAVATLDGTLMLVQNEIIMWSMQVDHQLFALTKLAMTSGENIVACSWDGQTYILDQEKHSVRFQLEESVCAFCSGYYSVGEDQLASACLVYITFTNKIYVYYDVEIPSMVIQSWKPQVDVGVATTEEEKKRYSRRFTEWCLYSKRNAQ